ncbi:HNH endonuclease signature motif containing protein [[Actinomadura] parvosata]|uniref:HNH endonuclease n=1 Tax=[Actinomadura] parvosata TaxID=1955412 RepID=UPI0009AD2F0D
MTRRECLDCRALHSGRGPRCPGCAGVRQRQRDQQRGTTTERGLGWDHQQAREQLLATATVCAICKLPPTPDDPLTAGHITPRAQGGTSDPSNYQAEHASCNYSKGATTGHTG